MPINANEIAFEISAAREDVTAESFHACMEKVLDLQAEENMKCYGGLLLCPRTLVCMCRNCAGYVPGGEAPKFCGSPACEYCGPALRDWMFWRDASAALAADDRRADHPAGGK